MKHLVFFLAAVFAGLFLALLNKNDSRVSEASKPTLKIFGYSSFVGRWGAGSVLKEVFEKSCDCKVEFIEGSDSAILLQRLKIEGESLGVDLIVGLDQFDLNKALKEHTWRRMSVEGLDFESAVRPALKNGYFVPFDWGILSFVAKKDADHPSDLDELLLPQWKGRIALQDPRTSSPGLQLVSWVLQSKPGAEGPSYLSQLQNQAHSYSPTWSGSYGLFSKGQVDLVFSYVTSPLYHQIEEKKDNYVALKFNEAHPIQIEFVGIPDFCRQCELAEEFVNLLLSPEGQKIIMEKNYMFPVIRGVRQGTPFDIVEQFPLRGDFNIPTQVEVEKILKTWSVIRRGEQPE